MLELKKEVVAVQLFIAIKRGLEPLRRRRGGPSRRHRAGLRHRDPLRGDVPAYFMGIAPSDLGVSRLIHCRAVGTHALLVVDRKTNRAVKVDVDTGVLHKDKELTRLRTRVIVKKRGATRAEHRRFFDRLGELIAQFVRVGDGNFSFSGPVSFPWAEFCTKLSFVPANARDFREFLLHAAVSPALANALVSLGFLDRERDAAFVEALLDPDRQAAQAAARAREGAWVDRGLGDARSYLDVIGDTRLAPGEKIEAIIRSFIAPVLENDGGHIDYLGFDAVTGEVNVRFVGSCANCPCSMLSLETIVTPPLLNVPGVTRVVHRGRLKDGEVERTLAASALEKASTPKRSLTVVSHAT